MEIPSAHFGRKVSRVVPGDAIVRVELRLPAPTVANGCSFGCCDFGFASTWGHANFGGFLLSRCARTWETGSLCKRLRLYWKRMAIASGVMMPELKSSFPANGHKLAAVPKVFSRRAPFEEPE